ncbi:MAG: c-type cytochrome [Bacteroidota bacterium]
MFASRLLSTSLLAGLCLIALLTAAGPARAELRGHGGFVKGIAVTPDGRSAVSASFDYSLILWDLESQRAVEVLDDHEGAVNAVALFDGGRRALSASDDGTVRLWSLADGGRLLHVFTGHAGKVAGVAVSPDGTTAASAGWDGTVRLWDLDALRERFVLDEHQGNVNAVAFSSDGRRLLTGSYDSTLRYFELPPDGSRPRLLATIEGHDFGVNAVAFLPDGRQAVSASVDETVRLWDLASGEEIAALRGHDGPVFAVAVSPDGQWIASGGVDGAINLWRLDERRVVATLYAHRQPVWSLAFTPDGRRLLSAGADEVTRVWDLASRSEIGASGDVGDAAAPAVAEAEDSRGAELFRKCAACHSVTADGGNRAGPTLYGVFGRRAGTLEGYNYSQALRHSEVVWSEETIDRLFALGPDEYTPGSKMPLQRMPSAEDREDLIAYLKAITGAERTAP